MTWLLTTLQAHVGPLGMTQLEARELINNGWFITSLCLVAIFSAFLIREMREDGWYARVRAQAALALLIYFVGETIARGWSVMLLYKFSSGKDLIKIFEIEQKFPIAMFGATVSFVGALCCVRVFSPGSWGHRGWIITALAAGVFMALTYVF